MSEEKFNKIMLLNNLIWIVAILLCLAIWQADKIIDLKDSRETNLENRMIGAEGEIDAIKKYLNID
jgi:hypothetical protein